MKKFLALFVPVIILLGSCGNGTNQRGNVKSGENDTTSLSGVIKIASAKILYPMVTKWVSEFTKINPKVKIDVKETHSDPAIASLIGGQAEIAMISRPLTPEEISKGLWAAPVAMDAVVPVISFDNSYIQALVMNGLSKDKLAGAFTGKIKTWGQLTGRKVNDPIQIFVQSDSSGATKVWNAFLGIKSGESKGTRINGDADIINALKKSKNGLGYSSILRLYDPQTGFRKEGIYIVPVDFNGNGVVEDNEQFYDNFNLFSNAIRTGKMPIPPGRELFIITKTKPKDKLLKEFIKWLLTIGQNYMPESGYINIPNQKANAVIETLK